MKDSKHHTGPVMQTDPSLLTQCPSCGAMVDKQELASRLFVCPACTYHFRLTPSERISQIVDPGSFEEFSADLKSVNPINLEGYESKLSQNMRKSDLNDAVVVGTCSIETRAAILGVMSFQFMGGSMGSVVGEKITQAILQGADTNTPVILFTASGGARMQEGIFSLMQMAKTASAAALLEETGTPLFIVLTNPTTGGVTASFAMLGDVAIAEPDALIGFAGPRVIEGTIGEKLPKDFQTAEFQTKKGFIDAVVPRSQLRKTLSFLLRTHSPRRS